MACSIPKRFSNTFTGKFEQHNLENSAFKFGDFNLAIDDICAAVNDISERTSSGSHLQYLPIDEIGDTLSPELATGLLKLGSGGVVNLSNITEIRQYVYFFGDVDSFYPSVKNITLPTPTLSLEGTEITLILSPSSIGVSFIIGDIARIGDSLAGNVELDNTGAVYTLKCLRIGESYKWLLMSKVSS